MNHFLERLHARQSTSPFPGTAGWALSTGGKAAYSDPDGGLVVKDGVAQFDPKTATARFLITTPRKDRHGDVVVPEGCKDSLADYGANPVVFFGHDQNGLPVGSCRKGQGLGIDFSEHGVYGSVSFHLKTLESEQVAALVEAGELRGASIGFLPVEAQVHEGKLERLDEESNVIKFEPFLSFTFLKWKLLEWSVVAIPANADTLRCRLDKGIGGKPVADGLKGHLEQYAAKLKPWSNGVSLDTKADEPTPTGPETKELGDDAHGPVVEEVQKDEGPGGSPEVGGPGQKHPPRKPGEVYFHKTLAEIGRHHGHFERMLDEHDHPDVVGHINESMAHAKKRHKATLAKAESMYPECDFSLAPAGYAAPGAETKSGTPAPDTSHGPVAAPDQLDLAAVASALKELAQTHAQSIASFKRATGRL